jgi:uncharacterized protein (DUF1800 family)
MLGACAAALGGLLLTPLASRGAIDANGNGLSDVWEALRNGTGLAASADTDLDGFTNLSEATAGTDPRNPASRPGVALEGAGGGSGQLRFSSEPGKRYALEHSPALAPVTWGTLSTLAGTGGELIGSVGNLTASAGFYRLRIHDTDTDADTATDWEEISLGFNPATSHTDRYDQADAARIAAGLGSGGTITVAVIDSAMREDWPDGVVFAIRRTGGLRPITVPIMFNGTASFGADYVASASGSIPIPAGVREVWVTLDPVPDALAEGEESVTLTALAGTGYALGSPAAASGTIEDAAPTPGAKEAARFLIQAAFGPNADSTGDADLIPENVESVMALGFEGWIDDQFARPPGLLQPWTDWAATNAQPMALYGNAKQNSWWNRVMGVPKLRPDDPPAAEVTPDPLRQRVAFALSEILVVSDRPEQLAVEQRGMANYYDLMVAHAFGNYEDLLLAVALHPAMGIYLSHLGNQKADPAIQRFPDENFAREIMQLFTIGLWELHGNGTRRLSDGTDLDPAGNTVPAGQPIPTYGNPDITELARVFTGLSFGNNANFQLYPRNFTVPMKMWDAEHDCAAKTLLGGLVLPARTPSAGNNGTAGMADVEAAVANLFNHPNVGPFIGRQLIQRLVTSNPGPDYVGRVAAAFDDNGAGVRGDMQAVIKAILLDPDARDPAKLSDPHWGKLREPLLRCANFAHALNASSPSGWYPMDQFALAFAQDPMNAPSVFNFFLPGHSPPGPLTQLGLVGPEFQIINASTAVTASNYFWGHILGDMQYWGAGNATYAVRADLATELTFVVPPADIGLNVPPGPGLDPDPMLRRLDLALTGGTLTPAEFQLIREAVLRIGPPTWQWHRERFRLAVYLILNSAEFNVLR